MRQAPGRLSGPALTLLLLVVTSAGWSCHGTGREAPRGSYLAATSLIDLLDEAEIEHRPVSAPIRVTWLEIGFDQQRALMQHPPSQMRFKVPVFRESFLSVAPAMIPASWETGTDGVGFEVRCQDSNEQWIDLFSLTLSPVQRNGDRGWKPSEISLRNCSSPSSILELRTTCGPARDCRWDWATWGEPQVLSATKVQTAVERLVLLVSIDTLRPDRTSVYGAQRPTTPELEHLAADGLVFETAVAPAPWTIPSHASLLTSTPPELHGAQTEREIHPGLPLLSQVLRAAGWSTAGFVDTPWLGAFGFERGYDHYDAEAPPQGTSRRGAAATRQRILKWLSGASGDAFIFWHVMDVHGPYGAPAPYGGRFRNHLEIKPDDRLAHLRQLGYHDYLQLGRFRSFADLLAAYDEGVLAADAELGRLLAVLRETGLYDDALIIVTSDHGESFMDHGVWVGHGLFLTEDEIRVPLVIKLPGNRHAGTRVTEMVRLLDVAPTVLDTVDISAPSSFSGLSLIDPRPGDRRALPRVAFGMSSNTGAHYVRTADAKLITAWTLPRQRVIDLHLRPKTFTPLVERIAGDLFLYDLDNDPTERTNLAQSGDWAVLRDQLSELDSRFGASIESRRQSLAEPVRSDGVLTDDEVERLKSLGYLGGDSSQIP